MPIARWVLPTLIATTASAFASSPWDGTWKLNRAKSQMTGTTLSITQQGPMYVMDNGPMQFKFACDGKDYPWVANRSLTCRQHGKTYTMASKIAGKQTSVSTCTVSDDGKRLSMAAKGTQGDGHPYTSESTFERVGGGMQGLAGVWKEVHVASSAPDVMQIELHGNMLRVVDTTSKTTSDTRLDGTPGPLTGARALPGMLIATTAQGKDKVLSVATLNGKEVGRDVMTLSPDGHTITDVSWVQEKPSEKQTFVYEKP